MNNQIDLGKIYGIQNISSDNAGLELRNAIQGRNIPSLEQIAEYNLASRGIDVSGTQNSDYPTGLPYDIEYNNNLREQDNSFVSTPTTTLNMTNQSEVGSVPVGDTAITDFSNPFPVTAESIQYLNGFIRTQIGRRITVTFLVGSNQLEEKSGFLLGVGANYILINELNTNDLTACDFYNIKFIRFYY